MRPTKSFVLRAMTYKDRYFILYHKDYDFKMIKIYVFLTSLPITTCVSHRKAWQSSGIYRLLPSLFYKIPSDSQLHLPFRFVLRFLRAVLRLGDAVSHSLILTRAHDFLDADGLGHGVQHRRFPFSRVLHIVGLIRAQVAEHELCVLVPGIAVVILRNHVGAMGRLVVVE